MSDDLSTHLATGDTTICRAWKVARRDGITFGFTDHDRDLEIDGLTYSARTGLSARALQQSTGLSVDNSEAVGALSDSAVREDDIMAGRFDDAEVVAMLVNWQDPRQKKTLFRGNFGEVTRENGAFRVELRGLTERLNLPMGRSYQSACSATFGDRACGLDPTDQRFWLEGTITKGEDERVFALPTSAGEPPSGWFDHGVASVIDGAAKGAIFSIRTDTIVAGQRRCLLWSGMPVGLNSGDRVKILAGCDKRFQTCVQKFSNGENFRGFPHIPGDDWLRKPPEEASHASSYTAFPEGPWSSKFKWFD